MNNTKNVRPIARQHQSPEIAEGSIPWGSLPSQVKSSVARVVETTETSPRVPKHAKEIEDTNSYYSTFVLSPIGQSLLMGPKPLFLHGSLFLQRSDKGAHLFTGRSGLDNRGSQGLHFLGRKILVTTAPSRQVEISEDFERDFSAGVCCREAGNLSAARDIFLRLLTVCNNKDINQRGKWFKVLSELCITYTLLGDPNIALKYAKIGIDFLDKQKTIKDPKMRDFANKMYFTAAGAENLFANYEAALRYIKLAIKYDSNGPAREGMEKFKKEIEENVISSKARVTVKKINKIVDTADLRRCLERAKLGEPSDNLMRKKEIEEAFSSLKGVEVEALELELMHIYYDVIYENPVNNEEVIERLVYLAQVNSIGVENQFIAVKCLFIKETYEQVAKIGINILKVSNLVGLEFLIGISLFKMSKYSEALEYLEAPILLAHHGDIHNVRCSHQCLFLGGCYIMLGQNEKAISSYRAVFKAKYGVNIANIDSNFCGFMLQQVELTAYRQLIIALIVKVLSLKDGDGIYFSRATFFYIRKFVRLVESLGEKNVSGLLEKTVGKEIFSILKKVGLLKEIGIDVLKEKEDDKESSKPYAKKTTETQQASFSDSDKEEGCETEQDEQYFLNLSKAEKEALQAKLKEYLTKGVEEVLLSNTYLRTYEEEPFMPQPGDPGVYPVGPAQNLFVCMHPELETQLSERENKKFHTALEHGRISKKVGQSGVKKIEDKVVLKTLGKEIGDTRLKEGYRVEGGSTNPDGQGPAIVVLTKKEEHFHK